MNLLIVDDESIFRKGLKDMVEKNFPELTVLEAEDGLDAMHVILNTRIDGMLVDINMPKMSGLELLETLREQNVHRIPTIIVSGFDDFEYARRAIRNEVCDYLLKPLTPVEAMETVSKLCGIMQERRTDVEETEGAQEKECIAMVEAACRYIEDHYTEDINIAGIAEKLGYNANYLSQRFKSETGEKIVDHLRNYRISKAKELLSGSSLKITEIARLVGIPNTQYFSTVFKALAGVTPQEYRENSNKM